jgi:hypothetical protein
MDVIKSELSYRKISTRLYTRAVIIKLVLFIIIFSAAFWYIRLNNLLPDYKLESDLPSIPALFSAGNLIFSVISAFIIQTQWSKWDKLIDANRGEINMMRQLFILAHHFPKQEMNEIRYHIYFYLKTYVEASDVNDPKLIMTRSHEVDKALVQIEDSMFNVSKKYKEIGPLAFSYLTRAMEYREIKIQFTNQSLPLGIRIFVIFATFSVIFGSLFVPFNNIGFNYYFTMVLSLLAFGIYLIIEDFDYPYRPGSFVLNVLLYKNLMEEIKSKLQQRGFDVEKADTENNFEEV